MNSEHNLLFEDLRPLPPRTTYHRPLQVELQKSRKSFPGVLKDFLLARSSVLSIPWISALGYCPLPPGCLHVCILPHCGLLFSHPWFWWLTTCLLSGVSSLFPAPNATGLLNLGSLLCPSGWTPSFSWPQPSLPRPSFHPHCLQDSNPQCQTIISHHPQPRPGFTVPQGLQGSPSPQFHLWYSGFVTLFPIMQAWTLRKHSILRLHLHLSPSFQSPNFKCPPVSAKGPNHFWASALLSRLAFWVPCWTWLPALNHTLFFAGVWS